MVLDTLCISGNGKILFVSIMKTRKLLITLLALVLSSCDKFEYSLYEVSPKDEYRNINQRNIARFINTNTDTLRIAVIGDTQRFYNSTDKVIKKINNRPNINFVIHIGDLVDFGLQREYTWMHELLSELNAPYVAVVGNHDLIWNGGEIYNLMYGEYNFSFTYNGNKFIYLNTCGREFGFESNVPNISWLDNELSDTSNYDHAIIVNHVPPYHSDFNSELEDDYVAVLGKYGKVMLSINGHNHEFSFREPYNDGIPYLNSYSTYKEKFVIVKIWDTDFSIETIE